MEKSLLEKTRMINSILHESANGMLLIPEICDVLENILDAKVCIYNKIGKSVEAGKGQVFQFSEISCKLFMDMAEPIMRLEENLAMDIFCNYSYTSVYAAIPVFCGGQKYGHLIAQRKDEFSDSDQVILEYGAALIGAEVMRRMFAEKEEQERERESVQMALTALSYSELEAAIEVFKELKKNDGYLITSKIADNNGIARSVIVNAIRKLESAGIIESRSLGMKGTHIRIIKTRILEVLSKYAM